jgi:hypothetical protein
MKSSEDKLSIKDVYLDQIYNFVVDNFFIWNNLDPINYVWSLYIMNSKFFKFSKWPQMEKSRKPKL